MTRTRSDLLRNAGWLVRAYAFTENAIYNLIFVILYLFYLYYVIAEESREQDGGTNHE